MIFFQIEEDYIENQILTAEAIEEAAIYDNADEENEVEVAELAEEIDDQETAEQLDE